MSDDRDPATTDMLAEYREVFRRIGRGHDTFDVRVLVWLGHVALPLAGLWLLLAFVTYFPNGMGLPVVGAFYGMAGGGHARVCRFPFAPVCQPPFVLPPSLGSEWQDFICKWSQS